MTGRRASSALSTRLDHRRRQVRGLVDVARWLGPRQAARIAGLTGNAPQVGEIARNGVYQAIWSQAAGQLGAECVDLSDGFFEIRSGDVAARVWQNLLPTEDPVALRLALHKGIVHRLLVDAGLPAPTHLEFDPLAPSDVVPFMESAATGVVIKPASGTAGGDGTTCGVRTRRELEMAASRASLFAPRALIERQVAGDVFRVLLLDGQLLDVVRRRSPTVVGDGQSTLGELIAAENRRRIEAQGALGLSLLRLDLDCAITLRRAGLSLGSVPGAGVGVRVKTATGEGRTADSETYTGPLAESVVEAARQAAVLTGAHLTGVDVIATDVGVPLRESGGIIAEVNGTPGIHHHYHVADPGQATRVAVPILRYVIDAAARAHSL